MSIFQKIKQLLETAEGLYLEAANTHATKQIKYFGLSWGLAEYEDAYTLYEAIANGLTTGNFDEEVPKTVVESLRLLRCVGPEGETTVGRALGALIEWRLQHADAPEREEKDGAPLSDIIEGLMSTLLDVAKELPPEGEDTADHSVSPKINIVPDFPFGNKDEEGNAAFLRKILGNQEGDDS